MYRKYCAFNFDEETGRKEEAFEMRDYIESSGTTFPCSRKILGGQDFGFSIYLLRGVNKLSPML